jgi:hypothetical protein
VDLVGGGVFLGDLALIRAGVGILMQGTELDGRSSLGCGGLVPLVPLLKNLLHCITDLLPALSLNPMHC